MSRGVWYIGGKKRQRGNSIPFGLLASIAVPVLREVSKPILGKIFGRGCKRKRRLRRIRR